MKPLVYLAGPYSHDDADVRHARFLALNKAAGRMMQEGILVFSPITHGHPMAMEVELPTDWAFWDRSCRAYLTHSHKVVVLKLAGWDRSSGVAAEVRIAQELGIPIEYLEP